METLFSILSAAIVSYLFLSALYQLILAFASKTYKKRVFSVAEAEKSLLILVPSYKADDTIIESTKANLALCMANQNISYLVIADSLQPETQLSLRRLGAQVLEVGFEKSTKVKSLKAAVDHLSNGSAYDSVLILDADNVLHPDFYLAIVSNLAAGYQVIQGERLPANQNTGMAILDGLSEKANQEMLCKGANQLGLSSKLTGSAMAFEYEVFVEFIPQLNAIGGFDKELELLLTSKGIWIQYAPELAVYDEKVSTTEDFAKQRGRWLESQYTFFKKSIGPAFMQLFAGNFDYLHKSLQLALPPRVIAPVALVVLMLINLVFGLSILALGSLVTLVILLGSYVIVLPQSMWLAQSAIILKAIPGLFAAGIKSLTWMKRSKKEFLHTAHKSINS
jgi:cellulose synthase/poly-beta-1,6-N-acetylglucosamine synthase-like glycosyltransferase